MAIEFPESVLLCVTLAIAGGILEVSEWGGC